MKMVDEHRVGKQWFLEDVRQMPTWFQWVKVDEVNVAQIVEYRNLGNFRPWEIFVLFNKYEN